MRGDASIQQAQPAAPAAISREKETAPAAAAVTATAPSVAQQRLAALRLPWQPRLSRQEAQRGLAYYGSGERLRAVAAKLLAGQPIKVRVERRAPARACHVAGCSGPRACSPKNKCPAPPPAAQAYALGGSTTSGKGASVPWLSFPGRFFEFLNASFPHRRVRCC